MHAWLRPHNDEMQQPWPGFARSLAAYLCVGRTDAAGRTYMASGGPDEPEDEAPVLDSCEAASV